MSSSKRYPEEFKIEAVKQVTEKGHSVTEVATRLGTTIVCMPGLNVTTLNSLKSQNLVIHS